MMDSMRHRQRVRDRLEMLRRHLEVAHAGTVVAAAALRRQNVERDEEIARVLTHCVGERLFAQIECAGELIDALQPPSDAAGEEGGNAGC